MNPDTGTVAERYLRYMVTVGDSLQRSLEPALGAQAAARARDGLITSKMNMIGCSTPR
jgi:hypothetical protein